MKNNKRSSFKPGSGCFKCGCCGRQTRTTDDNYETCPECWEIAGIENEISDGGYKTNQTLKEEYAQKLTEIMLLEGQIIKKGGMIRK